LEEAREKLTKGIAVWIREGSVAKDLHALLPLLNSSSSLSLGFCTDDRNPLDIATEGHLDYLVREAIRSGVEPSDAYRAASFSVALHYGLHKGRERIGAIAPGFVADLVLLSDVKTVAIDAVLKRGRFVSELERRNGNHENLMNTVFVDPILESDLEGVEGQVNVIRVIPGKIITDHEVADSKAKGIAKLTVLERHGKKSKPANAYVSGFGESFDGAIASSVGHDSHNLIFVGSNTKDMKVALTALTQNGGGFCVVKNGALIAELSLPFGGLMSMAEPSEVEKGLRDLRAASKTTGCELHEPFLQLAFLSLPVIPKLKLTDKGLVDVTEFQIIPVRAS
jgi:adenine deaminase